MMRNGVVEADPGLGAGGPDVQRRLEFRRFVERGKTNRHDGRRDFTAREQRSAAISAKAASRKAAAAGANRIGFRRTVDFHVRDLDDEARGKWSAAGALA